MSRPPDPPPGPPLFWDSVDGVDLPAGYRLTWLVDENGDRWPFVCDQRIPNGPVPWGSGLEALAPHEAAGRLPRGLRDRLGLVHRCGATTTAGRPCRCIVRTPGARCAAHTGQLAHTEREAAPAHEPDVSAPPARAIVEQLRLLEEEQPR